MTGMEKQVDCNTFRSVLGNYPTGVAVVTTLDASDRPQGMVVGTFTSVSIEPPLVAFLPMKTSRTFSYMREASERFCVNILAADQEDVSRTLSGSDTDKFATISWRKSPGGCPIIQGVVGWIDCEYADVFDGGDHHIVVGAVKAMKVERDSLPLVFFQRGYGRFSTEPLSLLLERHVLQSVRLAEAARAELEALAQELDVECSLIAPAGRDSIYVAVAAPFSAEQNNPLRLGVRAPLVPPLGALLVDAPNAINTQQWLASLEKCDASVVALAKQKLELVRERDWSISLLGALSVCELDQAIEQYTSPYRTPDQTRQFLSIVSTMFDLHEPSQINEDQTYDVLHLSVPVRGFDGQILFVLRLGNLPRGINGKEIGYLINRMKVVVASMEDLVARVSA